MSLRRSLVASVIGRYVALVIQLGGSLAIARILSPAELGVFGVAAAVVLMSSCFRDFGVMQYLVRATDLDRDTMGRGFALMMTLSLAMAGALWLSRGLIAGFFDDQRLAGLIGLMTVSFLLAPFGMVSAALMQREMAFTTLQFISLSGMAVGTLSGIGLAMAGYTFYSLAWAQIVNNLLVIALFAWLKPDGLMVRPIFRGWGEMFRFGVFNTLTSMISVAGTQSMSVILGRRLGFAPVGYFDRGAGLAGYVSNDMAGSVLGVVFVGLSKVREDRPAFAALYVISMANLTAVLWPACAVLAVLAEPVVVLLFGAQWRPAAPVLSVLSLSGMLSVAYALNVRVLLSFARTDLIFGIETAGQVVRIVATFFLAPYGLAMAAMGPGIAAAALFCCYAIAAWRHVHMSIRRLILEFLRSGAITLCTTLPVLAMMEQPWAKLPGPYPELFAGGAAAAVGWLVAVYAFRHPITREIAAIFSFMASNLRARQRVS